jgi:glycosyltransferase involved in cell wall biosynthesis
LRIAWIGLPYNLAYLDALAAPLASLAAAGHRCELRVISSALPRDLSPFAGVDVLLRPWSEAGEVDELLACDVGIMPLPDSPWAEGKCGLKLLQCMAAGLAVVASPVGVNPDIVQDGVNGLLASTPDEWKTALERLAGDPALRRSLGKAGQQTVAKHYSLERGARLVAETYCLACPGLQTPS